MNEMTRDKTDTETFEMEGKCPFGGDRIGGAFGTPPTLENWYPDRLRVELLHQNGWRRIRSARISIMLPSSQSSISRRSSETSSSS